jgi:dihydroorotase
MVRLSSFDNILTGGRILFDGKEVEADIGMRNGRIVALGAPNAFRDRGPADGRFSAVGLHILPGVIDSHVHFREPGKEDREDLESGSRGAVLGGVTCIFDMPNTQPSVCSEERVSEKLNKARGRLWCDFGFYVGADGNNTNALGHLETLDGVCGIKVFLSSSTTDLMVTDERQLVDIIGSGQRTMAFHAEDDARIRERRHIAERARDVSVHGLWRDAESSFIATKRVIDLAKATKRRVHILHVSTGQEMELIAEHKDFVSCEVLPQHLTFMAPDCYRTLGAKAQQNPPIREIDHQSALWRAILDGVVDVVASDHGPHSIADKAVQYPNMSAGMPGTQTLVPVMLNHVHEGKLSLPRLVELICAGPARVFGLRHKGRIEVGSDADFTIVDLKRRQTISNEWIASKVGWTAYDGMTTTGWPVSTFIRGHAVMRDGELCGPPIGKPAKFFSPVFHHSARVSVS